ncbi:hypothetical protein [Mesorhizobium sp. CA4]|uniref:hypothetical protein n=1 Tax=Mesorhizobium sp. CA4 TaxID=588499 RepID=UPI001CD0F28B|nr:hypothetical protein [Mesorhizobium sp. CA4]MBZ9822222.1 hypothetical protein [Mesorhizobium sp. CA4]
MSGSFVPPGPLALKSLQVARRFGRLAAGFLFLFLALRRHVTGDEPHGTALDRDAEILAADCHSVIIDAQDFAGKLDLLPLLMFGDVSTIECGWKGSAR